MPKTEKPSKALVRAAKAAGVELHMPSKRKKGESLLDYRCRDWNIPKPTFQPIDNNVIVWRLPPLALSAGGIVIPESDQSPHVKGIVLAMGPRARDTLASNGIEEGHIVIFGRFAGWEAHDNRPEYARHNQVLMIKDKDIIGSDDLKAEMEAGRLRVVQDTDGRHKLAKVQSHKLLPAKESRKEKLERLANGTSNPHEAETAKRLAKEMR
ncbi:MAG TPA: co-chaperone GroES family protein [Planctomycetota bacterium]|nr:co-chaperone GroES family protein [Planctomycetota bacterium]